MGEPFVLPRIGSIEDPLRLAVLISGGGSGLAALLKFQASAPRSHRTVLVLADSERAGGLDHGRTNGIESKGIPIPEAPSTKERRMVELDSALWRGVVSATQQGQLRE